MKTAREWKAYYAAERERLGARGLSALVDAAPDVDLPARGALVFPHTRLAESGAFVATAARAAVRSGADTVIAIGVLHGARDADREEVARARAGDAVATRALRRVHGPGAPGDDGRWSEEFSLDGFTALLAVAARREGRPEPRLVLRFPFLTGPTPADLPGLEEIAGWRDRGAALVATADVIHHGAGYGTPAAERLPLGEAGTLRVARDTTERGFALLARGDFAGYLAHAAEAKSDFRDGGPVVATLLGERGVAAHRIRDLVLVDYAAALDADPPTWVAAVLAEMVPNA